jgi:hypothetical protein
MKYLVLLIYSPSDTYDAMKRIQQSYIHSHAAFDCFFVTAKPDLEQPVKIQGDQIYVKGREGLLQILHKTLAAMDYLLNTLGGKYDFIIRTNVSTILHFNLLDAHLQTLPKKKLYTAGYVNQLRWLDPPSGISTHQYFGLDFASGTSIIMTPDIAKHMLLNADNVNHRIVDDVSIAIYVSNNFPRSHKAMRKYNTSILFFGNPRQNHSNLLSYAFIRNRVSSRDSFGKEDIANMSKQVKWIYSVG